MSDKKKPTGDREWLYAAVFDFISKPTEWDKQRWGTLGNRTDLEIYTHFAPLYSGGPERKTWSKKNRTVKRQMLASTIRRLIADGKIRIAVEESLNDKSMHGMTRSNIKSRQRLFGKEYDCVVRAYSATNALQAISDALAAFDG